MTNSPFLIKTSPSKFPIEKGSCQKVISVDLRSHSAWQLYLTQKESWPGSISIVVNDRSIPLRPGLRTLAAAGNGPQSRVIKVAFDGAQPNLSGEIPLAMDLVGLF